MWYSGCSSIHLFYLVGTRTIGSSYYLTTLQRSRFILLGLRNHESIMMRICGVTPQSNLGPSASGQREMKRHFLHHQPQIDQHFARKWIPSSFFGNMQKAQMPHATSCRNIFLLLREQFLARYLSSWEGESGCISHLLHLIIVIMSVLQETRKRDTVRLLHHTNITPNHQRSTEKILLPQVR